MGLSIGLPLILLLVLQFSDVQTGNTLRDRGRERAAVGTKCWFPDYYCSVTEGNTQTPIVVTGGAETCQTVCNNDLSCNFFTWFSRRGVESCYLLTECGAGYQIDNDWCLQRDSCYSGPKNCSTISTDNIPCAELSAFIPDQMEWQCEDGGSGLILNGYNRSLEAGTRCMLSCDSMTSFRWAQKSSVTYPNLNKGFLSSTCQADGSWSDVLPNDFMDRISYLEWPTPANLDISTYPKPDESSFSCICLDLLLVWPPLSNVSDSDPIKPFHYNPRDEKGARMECEDEVQNSLVASTREFRIKTNNTCNFLCDDFLVATVTCKDGKWSGGKDQGFWCYQFPKEHDRLTHSPELIQRWKTTIEYTYNSISFAISNQVVYMLNGADSGNSILKFNLEGNYLGQYPGWYNWPVDILIGGDEQVLLSAIGAMMNDGLLRYGLVMYNSSGEFFHGFNESETGLIRPYGLSAVPGSDSQVAVCDWDNNRTVLMEVDWSQGSITNIVTLTETEYPYYLVVTMDKVVVVSNVCCEPWQEKMTKLSLFDRAGSLITEVKELPTGEIISDPAAVAVDPSGNILLSDRSLVKTLMFSPEAVYIGEITWLGGDPRVLPVKMVFDQGLLYTLNQAENGNAYMNVYFYPY